MKAKQWELVTKYATIFLLVLLLIIDVGAVGLTWITTPGEDEEKIKLSQLPIFEKNMIISEQIGKKYLLYNRSSDRDCIYDIDEKKVVRSYSLEDYNISSGSWMREGPRIYSSSISRDGTTVAFVYIQQENDYDTVSVCAIDLMTSKKRCVIIHDKNFNASDIWYDLWIGKEGIFLLETVLPGDGVDGSVTMYEIAKSTMEILYKKEIKEMEKWQTWEVHEDGEPVLEINPYYHPLDVSQDGELLAFTDYERVYIYNLREGRIQAVTPPLGSPYLELYQVIYLRDIVEEGCFDHTGEYFLFLVSVQFITIREKYDLYVMDAHGGKMVKLLTVTTYTEYNIDWSFTGISEEDGDIYYTYEDTLYVIKDFTARFRGTYYATLSFIVISSVLLFFFSLVLTRRKLVEKKGWQPKAYYLVPIVILLFFMLWGIYVTIQMSSLIILMRVVSFAIFLVWITLREEGEGRVLRYLMPVILLGQMVATNLAFYRLL